jgi:hypothetical protein
MALSSVHVPLEGWLYEHPLLLEQEDGDGDGILLQVLWVDRDLMVPFPQVKPCSRPPWRQNPAVGQGVDTWLCYQVEQAKVAAGKPRFHPPSDDCLTS